MHDGPDTSRVLVSSPEDSSIPGRQSSEINRDSVSQIVENNVKIKMTHAGVLQYSRSTEQCGKLSRILKKPEFANTNIASKDKFYPKHEGMDEEIAMVENTAEEVNPSQKQTEILPADTQKHERSLLTQTSSESANLGVKLDLNKPKENSTIEAKKVPDAKQIFEALDSKKISEDGYNIQENSYEAPLPDSFQIKVIANDDVNALQNINNIENEKKDFEEDLKPAESSVNLPRLVLAPIEKDKDSVIKQERMVLGDPEMAKVGPTGVVIDNEGPMEKNLKTNHHKQSMQKKKKTLQKWKQMKLLFQ